MNKSLIIKRSLIILLFFITACDRQTNTTVTNNLPTSTITTTENTLPNSSNQDIDFGTKTTSQDITSQAVPEPSTILGVITALSFGTLFKKKTFNISHTKHQHEEEK